MGNAFVHVELNTDDLLRARQFYQRLFSWKLQDLPMGPGMTYTMIDAGKNKTGGGMQKKPMPQAPTAWMAYVEVDDVSETLTKATSLGARVVQPFTPIPGMGSLGIFVDPTGAALGVWAAGKKPAKKKPAKKPAPKKAKKRR